MEKVKIRQAGEMKQTYPTGSKKSQKQAGGHNRPNPGRQAEEITGMLRQKHNRCL